MGEVARVVDEGTPVEVADRAIAGLAPMPPFVLIGLVGPAIALHNSETLHRAFPERFHVSDNLLMDMESYFAAFLTNVDDEIDVWMLVDEITTETSGTTNVYGLDGDYYIDVMADGDWSFEFTPQ